MKCLIVMISLLLGACQSNQETAPAKEVKLPVVVQKPTIKDVTEYVEATGTLKPAAIVDVIPEVDGHLLQLFVKEGQWVEKGAKLFLVDQTPYQLKIQEAQALLAKEEADYKACQKKLERFQSLAHKDLIAQNEWDELESAVLKAKQELALCQARLKTCKLEHERCLICAKIKGRIGKLDVHVGQLVTSRQSVKLAQIVTLDPLMCEFHLTEKELAALSDTSESVTLESLALPGYTAEGTLTFIDNTFDPHSGQIVLRAKIANPQLHFRPGQLVHVRIPTAINQAACLIPQKAVKFSQIGASVFVLGADDVCKEVPIRLGNEYDNEVVVIEGLTSDDVVIIEGQMRLYNGAKAEVKS